MVASASFISKSWKRPSWHGSDREGKKFQLFNGESATLLCSGLPYLYGLVIQ
jgi:hypothetical protein